VNLIGKQKLFAVSYLARTSFIKKINTTTYVPFASEGSTLATEFIEFLSSNKNFIFEKIDGTHFFPMEKQDLICDKISNFIIES